MEMENEIPQIRIAEYRGVIALSTINHAANTPSVSYSPMKRIETTTRVSPRGPPFPRPRSPFFVAPGCRCSLGPDERETPGDIIATKRANGECQGMESGNEIEGGAFFPFNGRNCVEFFSLVAGTVCSIVCPTLDPRNFRFIDIYCIRGPL